MTPQQPHRLRCETCKYNYRSKEHKCPYDHADRYYSLKEEMRLPKGAWLFTSIVGCASHSAAAEPTRRELIAQTNAESLRKMIDEQVEQARTEGARAERERVLGVSAPAYGIKSHGTVQLSTVRRDDEECYRYAAYNHIPSFEVVRVRVIEEESLRDGGEQP